MVKILPGIFRIVYCCKLLSMLDLKTMNVEKVKDCASELNH